jgi:hypothetical protein
MAIFNLKSTIAGLRNRIGKHRPNQNKVGSFNDRQQKEAAFDSRIRGIRKSRTAGGSRSNLNSDVGRSAVNGVFGGTF